jgi:eukaryotic-like serine/threonine-protein kinase
MPPNGLLIPDSGAADLDWEYFAINRYDSGLLGSRDDMELTETGRLLSGRYRLRAVVGQGGMGVVWRARDELLNRDVAVKELTWPPHFTEAEQLIACRRAVREAQMAGRLAHPNVVRIYDILKEDGHPWIIMELLPYQSLRDLVREEGPLTPARAARVGLGVLAALRAAHAVGVLHRDVKPANILVEPGGRVVLTDFGIARATDSPTLTGAGALIGSPSYTAPERARGGQSSPAGDLWGLGVSLYAAVEGKPPFERNAPLATLTAVVTDEPEEAVHAGPLWPVISGLLRKEPDERLDAEQTERMLREVARRDEVKATPDVAEATVAEPLSPESVLPEPALPEAALAEAALAESAASVSAAAGSAATAADPAAAGATSAPDVPPYVTAAPPEPAGTGSPESAAASAEPVAASAAGAAEAPAPAAAMVFAGQPPPAVAPSGEPAARRPRRPRGPALALAALVAVAVAVTAVALALTSSPGHQAAASGTSSRSASHPAKSTGTSTPSPSATPSSSAPASSPASPGPSGSPAGSPGSASAGSGAVPAGYYRFTNSTGFSIGVPNGWQVTHDGHYVYVTDPSNSGIYLLIDQSDTPQPNPLADWQQQAANRAGTYPGYHVIRLESVSYPQAEKAADWEFTYVRDGIPVHILNRNVLANAKHAYALYWSTPESDWTADYHYFQAFADTFRPAQ